MKIINFADDLAHLTRQAIERYDDDSYKYDKPV